jgi:FtsP/CotA-like multicopper oxidase with cupredoxin domain
MGCRGRTRSGSSIAVGETVRWRWLNGSYLPHPMHLHGFHFRVTAKGMARATPRTPPIACVTSSPSSCGRAARSRWSGPDARGELALPLPHGAAHHAVSRALGQHTRS